MSQEQLFSGLKKYFNFDNFKSDIQRKAIECVLKGQQNVYVSMPTGSGKSLCYLLPGVLQENKVAIVISPLIALIKNQLDYLKSRQIRAVSLNSTLGTKERDAILGDLKSIKTETKFLYITPEQAATHSFQSLLTTMVKFNKVSLIAVDEAHCVSSWGHDFRKDYLKLGELRKKHPLIQWLALTATAPKVVRDDVLANLNIRDAAIFQVSCFRSNLYYDIVYKNALQNDFPELKEFIDNCLAENETEDLKGNQRACGIIYCRKKDTTEVVANGLRKQGLSCRAFHSGLKQSEKEQVQNDWMNGKVSVIVATVAFGMGIDKASVRLVVHWDVSQNIASYYQESGRAGRDGKKSHCRLYYDRSDVNSINFLLQQDINKVTDHNSSKYLRARNAVKEFTKIVDHCEAVSCRHLLFTKYFGDAPPECNSMCDVCANKKKCLEKVEAFQQVNANGFGSKIEDDFDPFNNEMYQGGRFQNNVKKGAFDEYDEDSGGGSGSGEAGERKKSEYDKKVERSFIDKQFALRKLQAATSMQYQASPKITRVRHASATEIKVTGLKAQLRESNLSQFISLLKTHLEICARKDPPELPNHNLNGEDLEEIGVAIEFRCFEGVKAISVYRRNFGMEYLKIKKLTSLYEDIKNYVPKKRTAHGGEYNTIVEDLKDRYGTDVVEELQMDIKSNQKEKNEVDKIQKKLQKTKNTLFSDNRSQTKIDTFFTTSIKEEENEIEIHSTSSEDMSVIDPKVEKQSDNEDSDSNEVEQVIKSECNEQLQEPVLENRDMEINENNENESINSNDLKDVEMQKCFNIDNGDGFPVEYKAKNLKRKTDDVEAESPPSKHFRLKDEEYSPVSVKMEMFESTNSYQKPIKRTPEEEEEILEKETIRNRAKNKGKVSQRVMLFLNRKYRQNKIAGADPKALFKVLARRITHMFYDRDPDIVPKTKEVERYVDALFETHEIVTSEKDMDNV